MVLKADRLVNCRSTGSAYFRARAQKFRCCAGAAGDAAIHRELLQLAQTYERMAADADIERQASVAGHDE